MVENNDIYYTSLLPVKKADTVKAKCYLWSWSQIISYVFPTLAILRVHILPDGNPVKIEANVAFYGFGLIIYSVFNYFNNNFLKLATKLARLSSKYSNIIFNNRHGGIVHFPIYKWLDSNVSPDMMLRQLLFLSLG